MATTETRFAQELIEMILRSETISPERRESYVERIMNGEFTEEMQQELATIFENEVRRLDDKIGIMGQALAATETELAEKWRKIEPDMQHIAEEDRTETTQTIAECKAAWDQAEREAEDTVEDSMREAEQTEAEAIRKNLKKPSESEQA